MIQTDILHFSYSSGPQFEFPALQVNRGESLLILGASGSGKSTWLQLISGLRKPERGEITLDGRAYSGLSKKKMDDYRAEKIGFIFQEHHFIPSLSAWDNLRIAFPSTKKFPEAEAIEMARELGLESIIHKKPTGFSQGEKQRLSILRAVLPKPALILADEPSSSLDDANCEKLINLLQEQCKNIGSALIVVTHDQRIKTSFERRIER